MYVPGKRRVWVLFTMAAKLAVVCGLYSWNALSAAHSTECASGRRHSLGTKNKVDGEQASVCAEDSRVFLSDLQLCSGHGKCVSTTGMCACSNGFEYGSCHRLQKMFALTRCFVGVKTVLRPQRRMHPLPAANPLSTMLLLL